MISVIAVEGAEPIASREFGGFLRFLRQSVLLPSPYAYQEASWLVPAENHA